MRVKQPYTLTKRQLPAVEESYKANAATCYNILCNPPLMTVLLEHNLAAHMRLLDTLKALKEFRQALGEVQL